MKKSELITYDLEMCCWNDTNGVGEIIEIGACIVDLDKQAIVHEKNILVRPEKDEVSDFCTQLTGITPRMVYRQGVPLKQALETLNKRFSFKLPWFAWGDDLSTLHREFADKGIYKDLSHFYNVAPLFRLQRFTDRKLGLRELCQEYNIAPEETVHRALPDARSLAKLMIAAWGGGGKF